MWFDVIQIRFAVQHRLRLTARSVVSGLRRRRGQQNPGRGGLRFQVLLHDQTAQGVVDHHRGLGQVSGDLGHVLYEVADASPAQAFPALATAVAAQVGSVSGVAVFGEVIQEVGPVPGAVGCAVHEEQGRRS